MRNITKLTLPARKMILIIAVATGILLAAALILCLAVSALSISDVLPMFTGIMLSSLVNIIKVFMLNSQVLRLSEISEQSKGRLYAAGQVLLRFALTAAGLIAAHFIPFEGNNTLYAAIISALVWNVAAFGLKYVDLSEEVSVSSVTDRNDGS